MPSDVTRASGPRPVCVMVRLVPASDGVRRASVELWTPAGCAPTPQPPGDDLSAALRQAAALSASLGFHQSYEFADPPDDVAACVRNWREKRAALDELRVQRALLEPESSLGVHRADGSRRNELDRANALGMLQRRSAISASILRRGFTSSVEASRGF